VAGPVPVPLASPGAPVPVAAPAPAPVPAAALCVVAVGPPRRGRHGGRGRVRGGRRVGDGGRGGGDGLAGPAPSAAAGSSAAPSPAAVAVPAAAAAPAAAALAPPPQLPLPRPLPLVGRFVGAVGVRSRAISVVVVVTVPFADALRDVARVARVCDVRAVPKVGAVEEHGCNRRRKFCVEASPIREIVLAGNIASWWNFQF
jgi:hypothetical protein